MRSAAPLPFLLFALPTFVQDAPPPPVDDEARQAVITSVAELVAEHYVFPDVAWKVADALFGKLEGGGYDGITDAFELTRVLTTDLRSVNSDMHFAVRIAPAASADEDEEQSDARRREDLRRRNFGFQRLEILPGNVGYLDLRQFADAKDGGAIAVAAMNFLSGCDAIVFDLRQNGGGHPSMIQLLLSYFFDEPTHLNSFFMRGQEQIDQFWTHAHVQGPRMTDLPLFVLTSSRTGSGAEEFSYDVKHLGRGTVIGEVTAGGAHPGDLHDAGHGFEVFISDGRAINPITGTNWERVGVQPDIATPAEQALDRGHLEALVAIRERLPEGGDPFFVDWALDEARARIHPVTVSVERMEALVGVYGAEHRISFRDGELLYSRADGGFQARLVPLTEETFAVEGLDRMRLRFERDEAGAVARLIGIQANGQSLEASPVR